MTTKIWCDVEGCREWADIDSTDMQQLALFSRGKKVIFMDLCPMHFEEKIEAVKAALAIVREVATGGGKCDFFDCEQYRETIDKAVYARVGDGGKEHGKRFCGYHRRSVMKVFDGE